MAAPSLDSLARELQPLKIGSLFIYANEAHPGENLPHHTSFQQKLAHARQFRDHIQLARPLLIDNLDGACHRAYGGMPNMSWIFDRAGRPVYKANWTEPESIRAAVADLLAAGERRREQRAVQSPFRVERLEYRIRDEQGFKAGLERAGPKAVAEFAAYQERELAREQQQG